jgi:hypothetical protein
MVPVSAPGGIRQRRIRTWLNRGAPLYELLPGDYALAETPAWRRSSYLQCLGQAGDATDITAASSFGHFSFHALPVMNSSTTVTTIRAKLSQNAVGELRRSVHRPVPGIPQSIPHDLCSLVLRAYILMGGAVIAVVVGDGMYEPGARQVRTLLCICLLGFGKTQRLFQRVKDNSVEYWMLQFLAPEPVVLRNGEEVRRDSE